MDVPLGKIRQKNVIRRHDETRCRNDLDNWLYMKVSRTSFYVSTFSRRSDNVVYAAMSSQRFYDVRDVKKRAENFHIQPNIHVLSTSGFDGRRLAEWGKFDVEWTFRLTYSERNLNYVLNIRRTLSERQTWRSSNVIWTYVCQVGWMALWYVYGVHLTVRLFVGSFIWSNSTPKIIISIYGLLQRKWYMACSIIKLYMYFPDSNDSMLCGCASARPFTPYITWLTSYEHLAYSG